MQPKPGLSLFDSTCIIAGIIVGAGIFETPPAVARCMGGPAAILGVWLLGGLLAAAGALCYAELASAYPHQGGDYVYLNRAFGGWAGFLFGWSQLVIIRPGDIALMAFIFARYARPLFPFGVDSDLPYAVLAVTILTAVNIAGVRQGKWTQNLLTVAKALGLLAIVVAGLLAPENPSTSHEPAPLTLSGLNLALILVMFTFGGWNEIVYVSAEVRRPERNILRALVLGVTAVTVLYLGVNAAYLGALGPQGMAYSQAVAVDTVAQVLPGAAARVVNLLICLSALGAVNGLILTGARISYAVGKDHRVFQHLGRWNSRLGTPIWALGFQSLLSLAIILLARSFIDTILYSAPVVWTFFLATGISLFVLRRTDRKTPRPFKVIGYPVTPIVFCAFCAFMVYSCVTYAYSEKPLGLGISLAVLAAGALLYAVTPGKTSSPEMESR